MRNALYLILWNLTLFSKPLPKYSMCFLPLVSCTWLVPSVTTTSRTSGHSGREVLGWHFLGHCTGITVLSTRTACSHDTVGDSGHLRSLGLSHHVICSNNSWTTNFSLKHQRQSPFKGAERVKSLAPCLFRRCIVFSVKITPLWLEYSSVSYILDFTCLPLRS